MFHDDLKAAIDTYVRDIYRLTKRFPADEQFGVTSQLRRAALSVALNYVEGYARQSQPSLKQFLKIAYASLQESIYLVEFSAHEEYLSTVDQRQLSQISKRIAQMIWGILRGLGRSGRHSLKSVPGTDYTVQGTEGLRP